MATPEQTPKKFPPGETPPAAPAVEITAAEVIKRVKRPVPVPDEKGKPTDKTKLVPLAEEELLAWAVRGQRLVVVTTDGQKLEGRL